MNAGVHLAHRLMRGDRRALARLLTWIENGPRDDSREVASLLFHASGHAHTVGITGPPGVGKSTLTDKLIGLIRTRGENVGVIAVDPSSPFTGGAILGDRIRMESHAEDGGVFIRSMATRGRLGGLAIAVPEAIRALDAYGLGWVIVETAGVGQVEVEVMHASDTTVVVLNPGWGDHIQVSKAGLLEIADIFDINKADRPEASRAATDLRAEINLGRNLGWHRPVITTIALTGEGLKDLLAAIEEHQSFLEQDKAFERRRYQQLESELRAAITELLSARADAFLRSEASTVLRDVIDRKIDPYSAAELVLRGSLASR